MQVIEQLKTLSDDRFLSIYESLARDGFGPLDSQVAQAMKFRPHAIKRLPMTQRARRARTLLQQKANAQLAYELFGTYLMSRCKELVTDFLDATGVPHEDGLIKSVESDRPDPQKVASAVADLDAKYDADDVTLYLSMCAEQWPGVPEVEAAWKMR